LQAPMPADALSNITGNTSEPHIASTSATFKLKVILNPVQKEEGGHASQ